MKKILITGHLGVIGTIISPRLNAMGYEIVGYDLKEGDELNDTEKLTEKLEGVQACVHLAGIPGPWGKPWSDYQHNNVNGTLSVIKACLKAKVDKIIYMSSGVVYGFTTGNCKPDVLPIKEDNTPVAEGLLDNYDVSKIKCEKHLEEASKKHGLTTICLRLDTPTPHAPVLPHHLFMSINEGNLAESIRASLESDFKGHGAFNIGDPTITDCMNVDIQEWIKTTYPDVPNTTKDRETLFDLSKARKLLGYNPA